MCKCLCSRKRVHTIHKQDILHELPNMWCVAHMGTWGVSLVDSSATTTTTTTSTTVKTTTAAAATTKRPLYQIECVFCTPSTYSPYGLTAINEHIHECMNAANFLLFSPHIFFHPGRLIFIKDNTPATASYQIEDLNVVFCAQRCFFLSRVTLAPIALIICQLFKWCAFLMCYYVH